MKTLFNQKAKGAIILLLAIQLVSIMALGQHSVARQWNETQLSCIRKDFARPTVQARNLGHAAVVMYDCWAAFDNDADTYFLGKTWGNYTCPFDGIQLPADVEAAQDEAISYAMFRYLKTRYGTNVPPANYAVVQGYIDGKMLTLGYDPLITSTDYSDGSPAKFGNYIAAKFQEFALQDGANQGANYANQVYAPINGDIWAQLPGNPLCIDPNRWQEMSLSLALDQGGNPIPNAPPALTPEWGNVTPFSMTEDQKQVFTRDGIDWPVYLDQGAPPYIDTTAQTGMDDDFYKWGYITNIIWHSFHTPTDGVTVDTSPNTIGGLGITDPGQLPTTFEEYKAFYDVDNGGDPGTGYDVNPATGLPYTDQTIPRGDYTRVLSEYWADGPASETPPGHWFTVINTLVADNPLFEKRWEGQGDILPDLEWDVRAYLALGGGIHDAAIACWGAKGYYDYTRPIMAIRYMATKGQSSDPLLPHYHPAGLPLIPGFIELVQMGDPLAGDFNENVDKIKVYSWRGPQAGTGQTGVGWLLGEFWWTYQKATFVTPPFPGYYSGHSTYSRTGAEILTLITGDPYFPGGMGEYVANPGYLGADSGPSVPVHLQWATYRDASDQCSLSRIYGGLHPPQDDIPGRKVGLIIGPQAFDAAESFMNAGIPHITAITVSDYDIQPENIGDNVTVTVEFTEDMNTAVNPTIEFLIENPVGEALNTVATSWADDTHFTITYQVLSNPSVFESVMVKVTGGEDLQANGAFPAQSTGIHINTFTCTGDFNGDEVINVTDLLLFMSDYACLANCLADLNDDGVVNVTDLLIFMSIYGQFCEVNAE